MPNSSTVTAAASITSVTSNAIHPSSIVILLTLTLLNRSFFLTTSISLVFLFSERDDGKINNTFFTRSSFKLLLIIAGVFHKANIKGFGRKMTFYQHLICAILVYRSMLIRIFLLAWEYPSSQLQNSTIPTLVG